MTPTYQNLLRILSRYLSQVNAKLALDRALRRIDVTPASLGEQHTAALLPLLERSLNLFVEHNRLPQLLAELGRHQVIDASALEEKVIVVASEQDLSEVRIQARQICQEMGATALTRQKAVTLVSELARNIVLYAGEGQIALAPSLTPRKRLVVRATDNGPGIPNLQAILAGDYRSKTGLGMGLRGCKRLADRFEIDTGSSGTRIEAEVYV